MKKEKSKESEDKDQIIQKLEEKILYQSQAIKKINEKLSQCLDRLGEIRQEKEILVNKIKELEIREMDFKLLKHDKLQNDYDKMSHRTHITKKQLDESREELKFLNKVIGDMERRGLVDYIKNRYPESFQEYKKKK